MKATFTFDGECVYLRLEIQDESERAIAKLMSAYNVAKVSVDYGRYGDYGYSHRETEPKAVEIYLRQSVKCFATGGACEKGCKAGAACELTAAQPGER